MCHGFGLLFWILAVGITLKIASCAFRRRWYAYNGYGGGCGDRGGGCGSRGRHWGHHHHGFRGRWREDEQDYRGDRDGRDPSERGGSDEGERYGFGFGRRFFLRFLFERLDTTPGQEKVIASAFEEIQEAVKSAKGEWAGTRGRVADAMRGAEFDVEAVGDAWAKHDSTFETVRLKITTTMQRVHEALDERQRKILAELIEKGGPFGRWGRE